MGTKRIKIDRQISMRFFYVLVFIFIVFTVSFFFSLHFGGFGLLSRILLGMVVLFLFTSVLVFFVANEKIRYLSDIYVSQNHIILVYRIQDKIVEEVRIKKSEIDLFKVDAKVRLEKNVKEKTQSIKSFLKVIVKLNNGKIYSNRELFDFELEDEEENEFNIEQLEQTISKIENPTMKADMMRDFDFILENMEKIPKGETNYVNMLSNYSFLFDFISCEQIIPNFEFNMDIKHPMIIYEIDFYRRYGKRRSIFFKIIKTYCISNIIITLLCVGLFFASKIYLICKYLFG